MRIAILGDARSIHTVKIVNALSERDNSVVLYSLKNHKADNRQISSNVIVKYLKFNSPIGYYLNALQLNRWLLEYKPDVLNAHYASGYGTLARLCGFRPLLLSVWGSDVYSFPYHSIVTMHIIQKNIESATAISSTSNAMVNQVKRLYHSNKNIYVTPFGVDIEKFRPLHKQRQGLTIGIVKTMKSEYGIEYLLQGFDLVRKRLESESRIPDGGIWLEIYGGGPMIEEYKRMAKKLGIYSVTKFYGLIPHDDVPKAINRMDIFCAPSITNESFGVAAVEAMACGVPVVASDADGFCEVLVDRLTGIIVPRFNVIALSNALYYLAIDVNLRERMGKAGRERVLKLFNWQENITTIENALRSCILVK